MISERELRQVASRKALPILQRGKARDYYDVWRLLREKADAFDHATARRVLTQKCTHKGLPNPILADFLRPDFLQDAAAYWVQELADQIPGGDLPLWTVMQEETEQLLGRFLA